MTYAKNSLVLPLIVHLLFKNGVEQCHGIEQLLHALMPHHAEGPLFELIQPAKRAHRVMDLRADFILRLIIFTDTIIASINSLSSAKNRRSGRPDRRKVI